MEPATPRTPEESLSRETEPAQENARVWAVDPKTKPIIFWGAWLCFAPTAAGALWAIRGGLDPLIRGGADKMFVADGIATFVMALLYAVSSIWALWAVSVRYLRKSRS